MIFQALTVIINKPSPVVKNLLISQMRCCRTQLEQKPTGRQTPEELRWAPMFQVINGALESIIAGSSANGSYGTALAFQSIGKGDGWHFKLCLIILLSIRSGVITWSTEIDLFFDEHKSLNVSCGMFI